MIILRKVKTIKISQNSNKEESWHKNLDSKQRMYTDLLCEMNSLAYFHTQGMEKKALSNSSQRLCYICSSKDSISGKAAAISSLSDYICPSLL